MGDDSVGDVGGVGEWMNIPGFVPNVGESGRRGKGAG